MLCTIWGFFIEPRRLVVTREELALPGWDGQPPLRVALVSDLHIGSPHWGLSRVATLVERVNAEEPDIILLAGDYTINGVTGGTRTDVEPIAQGLAALHAKHGVVAILGNHDWYNDGERTRRALEANNIRVLENEVYTFERDGRAMSIAGLADLTERLARPTETYAGAPAGPVIALIHEPDVFARNLSRRPSIVLAGHTHGGQVWVPFFGHPVIPSDFGQRFARGHVVEDGRHLFVTSGVGTSIYPVRFGVPPEIAVLTLRGE